MTLCAAGSLQQLSEHGLPKHKHKLRGISPGTRTVTLHSFEQSCTLAQCRFKRRLVHIRSFLEQSVSPRPDKNNRRAPYSRFGAKRNSDPDSTQFISETPRCNTSSNNSSNLDTTSKNAGVQLPDTTSTSVHFPVSLGSTTSISSLKVDLSDVLLVSSTSSNSVVDQSSLCSQDASVQLLDIPSPEHSSTSLVQLPAAKQIVALLTAWDNLSGKLSAEVLKCSGSQLLLAALKIAIPAFQQVPYSKDGRFELSRALEVAYTLADLRMNAEVIAAGILRVALDGGSLSISDVQRELGTGTVHILHDCMRASKMSNRLDSLDNHHSSILRQFSLAYHDVRALSVELAARLDGMRHIRALPKHRQQSLALENMQVYAPLAHALGFGNLSQELEDMAFEILFPDSYRYVEDWLQCHWGDGEAIISESTQNLTKALMADGELRSLTDSVKVTGRCKSRFSTMKKLLKDGRRPDQVYDILGLRIILSPKSGMENEAGVQACYRARSIVTRIWKEVPGRMKDYIEKPKENGYSSLHLAVYLTSYGSWSLPMELQIRTAAMHAHAVAGAASHALYKGGLTDPKQVQHFKAVMLAAANASAYRFQNGGGSPCSGDHIFDMFDENKDGVISREEFEKVIVGLGADKADAYEMVELVDSNADGAVDVKELGELQRQIRALPSAGGVDSKYSRNIQKNETRLEMKQVPVF